MKVTKDNYESIVKEIGVENLSESLKKGYSLVDRVTKGGKDWSKYPMFKKAIDSVFEALGLLYDKNKKSATSSKANDTQPVNKTTPESDYKKSNYKTTSEQTKKQKSIVSPTYEKPKVKGKGVELIGTEVSFIKRFVGLHNRTKTKDQVGSFIRSLQKAIVEKRIRKTSRYANTIREIQNQLVGIYKKMANSIKLEFEPKDLNRYYKIAGAEIVMPSIRFIKAFVSLSGKEITKHKAKNLLDRVKKALASKIVNAQDKYYKEVKTIINSLEDFLSKQGSKSLSIRESQLNGLQVALQGCGCEELKGINLNEIKKQDIQKIKVPHNTIMNSQDVVELKTDKLNFTGKWLTFIGNPSRGFTAMIYGKPKFGKSYLAIDLAGYLARNHGKVLYVAYEEGFDDTLKQKLQEKNVAHPNLFVADYLPTNLSSYEYIFIDSVNKAGLTPEDLDKLERKNARNSFIYIYQTTKDGNHKGAMEHKHNVDVVIEVPQRGIATQYGRYNQGGEMKIFE